MWIDAAVAGYTFPATSHAKSRRAAAIVHFHLPHTPLRAPVACIVTTRLVLQDEITVLVDGVRSHRHAYILLSWTPSACSVPPPALQAMPLRSVQTSTSDPSIIALTWRCGHRTRLIRRAIRTTKLWTRQNKVASCLLLRPDIGFASKSLSNTCAHKDHK